MANTAPPLIQAEGLASAKSQLFFSVGEPSGDLHAARLLKELLPFGAEFRGFGGEKMRDAGCHLDYLLTELAVVGFVEVAPKLREFFRVADIASHIFENSQVDGVVLVDFPGFNWHIAKRAKACGIPVFYYLPPQLWAWGKWRVRKMRDYVDHILCNLPFEEAWYREQDLEAEYVGHPFFDKVEHDSLDAEFLRANRDEQRISVAVLPGSRSREVKHIWPIQLSVIRELSARHPHARFMVACLREEHRQRCEAELKGQDQKLPIEFFVDRTSEVIELADCSLMKSGSVSLEMLARGTPSVVVYHVSRMLYNIASRLTNINSITLPNMIAQKTIMPEFLAIGGDCTPTIEKCIAAMDRLMGDRDERIRQQLELLQLKREFGAPGASVRAATSIASHLGLERRSAQLAVA